MPGLLTALADWAADLPPLALEVEAEARLSLVDTIAVMLAGRDEPQVARARAEGKRAAAVAEEQENQAKIQESKAQVMLAQAAVPHAMADAFRSGKLDILDYYKLRNIQADTDMRKSISAGGTSPTA